MGVTNATARVSELMRSQHLLAGLGRSQSALNRVQMQMTSGRQILAASEDPVLSGRILDLSGVIGRLAQFQTNAGYADGMLATADAALGEATDIVRQAHTLALGSIGATAGDDERAANARILDSLIGQLQRLANRAYLGRYLFGGQAGSGEPFTDLGGGIAYAGGSDPTRFSLEAAWSMEVELDGASVFGGWSGPAGAETDLDPVATGSTRVEDLHGAAGAGVSLGQIRVSDGLGGEATVDLGSAATLGGVIDLFNASAPPGMSMSLDGSGTRLRITAAGGSDIAVSEVGAGTAARDLGIATAGGGADWLGGDLDPKLTERTELLLLRGGAGIDAAGGIVITNGSLSATVTFGAAQTVQHVLNAINSAGAGIRASVAPDGRGLRVVNAVSGTTLRIVENGGTTAQDLGIRTFHDELRLNDLNDGRGVGRAGPGKADLRITQRDGTQFDVELSTAATIGDVMQAIKTAPGNSGSLVASIAPDGGIALLDGSADLGFALAVEPLNLSAAAADLGLLASAVGPLLTGADVSGVDTGGVFSRLIHLRNALAANDSAAIARQAERLEADLNSLIETRGTVGAQAAQVARQADRLDDNLLDTRVLLSQVRDLDLTEAVLRFQQLQTQLNASLTMAGRLLNVSLLDFLR